MQTSCCSLHVLVSCGVCVGWCISKDHPLPHKLESSALISLLHFLCRVTPGRNMKPHLSCLLPSHRLSPELACSASIMNWFSLPLKLSLQALTDGAVSAAWEYQRAALSPRHQTQSVSKPDDGRQLRAQETFIWQHWWKYYLRRAPRWLLGTRFSQLQLTRAHNLRFALRPFSICSRCIKLWSLVKIFTLIGVLEKRGVTLSPHPIFN